MSHNMFRSSRTPSGTLSRALKRQESMTGDCYILSYCYVLPWYCWCMMSCHYVDTLTILNIAVFQRSQLLWPGLASMNRISTIYPTSTQFCPWNPEIRWGSKKRRICKMVFLVPRWDMLVSCRVYGITYFALCCHLAFPQERHCFTPGLLAKLFMFFFSLRGWIRNLFITSPKSSL